MQEDASGIAPHGAHARAEAPPVPDGRAKRLDIDPRAAVDGAPDRPAADLQKTVIPAEADEGGGRVVRDLAGRKRPDGGGQRVEMILPKGLAVAARFEILAKRRQANPGDLARGVAVEAHDVAQHRPESEFDDIASLGEQTGDAGAGIFEIASANGNRKRHFRWPARRPQMREQRLQVGIGRLVVNDEAGVDGRRPRRGRAFDGVAVAARPALRLEHRHFMPSAEQPGRGKA